MVCKNMVVKFFIKKSPLNKVISPALFLTISVNFMHNSKIKMDGFLFMFGAFIETAEMARQRDEKK